MAEKAGLTLKVMPDAVKDLASIWEWNAARHGPALADKYVSSIKVWFDRLCQTPMLGQGLPELPGVRRLLVKKRSTGYGHLVFYRVYEQELQVLRIFHTAQDWQSRFDPTEQ